MKIIRKMCGALFLLAVLLWGCGDEVVYQLKEDAGKQQDVPAAQAEGDAGAVSDGETAEEPEKSTIVVHVCGAVARPGVYELAAGSRAEAAVKEKLEAVKRWKAAGGLTGDALEESLNQARILTDGEQIRVLTKEEAQNAAAAGQEGVSGGKIDINTADISGLVTLNGIGETKAEAIIAYREAHGGFKKIEDICEVDGIGEKTFEKIKDSITVS